MKNRVIAAAAAAGLILVGLGAPAHADSDPTTGTFDLITNGGSVETSIDIGDVQVDGLHVTVTQDPDAKFNPDNPKPLVLTDLKAEAECAEGDFPLNKQANLIPGKLAQDMTQTSEYVWEVDLADPGCANPKIAVKANATQDDTSGLEAIAFEYSAQPVQFRITKYPGTSSYFDTTIYSPSSLAGTYAGSCADEDNNINVNVTYNGTLYPYYDLPGDVQISMPENFDAVTWLLNHTPATVDINGVPQAVTKGDVQVAIWLILGENTTSPGTPYSLARAQALRDLALANGEGYEPACGDQIPMVLYVPGKQTTLVQTTFIQLQVPCEGYAGGSGTAMALDTTKTEVEGGNTRYGNQFDGDNWFGYVQVEAV